jgi:molybdenum cofactor cytidylyltransferase
MDQLAIIILAAGSSSRLGQPKQLLPYKDSNLLQHIITEALKGLPNVYVVLGSNQEIIKDKLNQLPVAFVFNEDWETGMSSSIRCGISQALIHNPLLQAVILMVTDQPFVSSSLIAEMLNKYQQSRSPIIACTYKETVGVPVLFDRQFFSSLLRLKGQTGAKKIVEQHIEQTQTIPFPMGYVDIDTPDDYNTFKKMKSSN